jgi:sterol 3beta-glucosyltransferase
MRLILTNFGTMGDVRPLFALGHELETHGHRPILVVPPFAVSMASRLGLKAIPLGPDLWDIQDRINLGLSGSQDVYDSENQMFALFELLEPYFDQIFADFSRACLGGDVLISGPSQPFGKMVHELTGVPFVSLQIANFGGNGGRGLRRAGDLLINPFRKKLGLAPLSDALTHGANSPQLTIYAMSAHLRPRAENWPAHYRMTGFFFDALHEPFEDPALTDFLAQGEPPVVITFGSMVHHDKDSMRALVRGAVRLAGCRAIAQGMGDLHGPDEFLPIYWTGFVPHAWLLPKASCVVLHGGCGTAGAVFRSGVPGIFVPHGVCYDQHYWGQIALELGCAVRPLPFQDVTETVLASSIRATLTNPSLRSTTQALARKIRTESGVTGARRLIEQLVARIGLQRDEGAGADCVEKTVER